MRLYRSASILHKVIFPRLHTRLASTTTQRISYSTNNSPPQSTLKNDDDIDKFLSEPTWSVQSLLPTEKQIEETTEVTAEQLHHLLRLSALPRPATVEDENKMLRSLRSQLHFVKEIQKVDTTGVDPLQSIRDETLEARKEIEINKETLKDALAQEEVVGKHHKRVRRKQDASIGVNDAEDWDVLGQASSKVGKYFVVHHRGES